MNSDRSLASDDEGSGSVRSALQSQSSIDSSLKSSFDSESENQDGMEYNPDDSQIDPEFRAQFDATKSQFIQLRNQTIMIQRKLLYEFPTLGFVDSTSSSGVNDFPHRYQDALDRLEIRRAELDDTKQHYETELTTLQKHCTESERLKLQKEDEFRKLRDETGKDAIIQRTNKPLKLTDLNSKENALSTKEYELETARIDYIRTKNKHKQTEEELNKQDQLSEGLHLIDFEQLKIENQTLNEKKAEKSQDLVKIKTKIESNAHILTHVKEKLNFVRRQKVELMQKQQEMDNQYSQSRAKLAIARIHRDKVRDENSSLKKSSGLIGMTDLLYDFENRSNELELMQDRVTELKTRFNDLSAMQHELEAKISQRQPLDPSLMKMNR